MQTATFDITEAHGHGCMARSNKATDHMKKITMTMTTQGLQAERLQQAYVHKRQVCNHKYSIFNYVNSLLTN